MTNILSDILHRPARAGDVLKVAWGCNLGLSMLISGHIHICSLSDAGGTQWRGLSVMRGFMKMCMHVGPGLRAGSWACGRTGGWIEEGIVHKETTV